ncbi:hypothetical protein NDU88_002698 [Pleurodeles waltl]|uniref:Uncharacterized protein n=1 Tax=Pleurodeles waltl TaxID=8319 RepID=A0AAV7VBA3_PLEWA|nr:hypothetical protein NDU88_002698 [Pleurodeles waltl]
MRRNGHLGAELCGTQGHGPGAAVLGGHWVGPIAPVQGVHVVCRPATSRQSAASHDIGARPNVERETGAAPSTSGRGACCGRRFAGEMPAQSTAPLPSMRSHPTSSHLPPSGSGAPGKEALCALNLEPGVPAAMERSGGQRPGSSTRHLRNASPHTRPPPRLTPGCAKVAHYRHSDLTITDQHCWRGTLISGSLIPPATAPLGLLGGVHDQGAAGFAGRAKTHSGAEP